MDIFNLFKIEKAAYDSIKRNDTGKEMAKNLIKPGLLFCLFTAIEAVMSEGIDYLVEKYYMENEDGDN